MPKRLRDQILLETELVVHIAKRDRLRRYLAEGVIVAVAALGGAQEAAWQLGIVLLFYEMLELFAFRQTRSDITNPRPMFALTTWVLSVTSLTAVVYPAIVLAHIGTTPMLLIAFMWLFGILVHVSTSYAALPFYKWTMTVPPAIIAVIVTIDAGQRSFEWTNSFDVIMAVLMMMFYFSNTYEAMSHQKDTHIALNEARKKAQARLEKLEKLARCDPLTGLKNRQAFEEDAAVLLDAQTADDAPLTLYLIDLDGFKPINDSYTHAAGDAILCEIGRRLTHDIDQNRIVARLGGDEFAVAVCHQENMEQAEEYAEKMCALINEPIAYGHRRLTVGCSIGLTRATSEEKTIAHMLSQADQAMFRAKNHAMNATVTYDPKTFPVRATLDDRTLLRDAMKSFEIRPFYQPKIDLNYGTINGMEALSRWQHPTKGMIMPGTFIPMINELSLQGEFLLHTLRTAIADIGAMVAAGLNPGQVSVNLPEVTLATISGRNQLLDLLAEHPATLPHLTFEVTEDIFIARSGALIQASIAEFRRIGVRISLDDFGTGFASFQHLRELEFDELKLDTGFVRGLGEDPSAEVLVKAFLDIGHGLDVDVIAEGVENERQRDILRNMGCARAQGFLFSKAVPIADLQDQLQREQLGPIYKSSVA